MKKNISYIISITLKEKELPMEQAIAYVPDAIDFWVIAIIRGAFITALLFIAHYILTFFLPRHPLYYLGMIWGLIKWAFGDYNKEDKGERKG